ncbi:MAG TPA: NADH-quinone oxidoreductase subunit NuoH [Anaerolineae bacterium]|nr:NADH-quinone oxidoreductase subunit NuoH [Anaerolineae bacterium]
MDILELLKATVQFRVFDYLRELYGPNLYMEAAFDLVGILTVSTFCLLIVLFLILWERWVIARIQDRIGPNRVGKWGMLQTVADVGKLLTKEVIIPRGADKPAYIVAPLLIVMASLVVWAVLPFAPGVIGTDLNIGVFYFLAVSSASVVCLLLAGWGSNNKYALLGAFRAVAQLVSYEVPMVISLVVPILLARSMSTQSIVEAQVYPFFAVVPLSAIIFFISALAETGRTPFDLLEAESEIVAGFHVEYTGMLFGMFFLAEFISTLFMSGLFATVYLGGWNLPLINLLLSFTEIGPIEFANPDALFGLGRPLALLVFFAKMFGTYFVFIWIRGTLPRVRVDQMLDLNWKFLVPLSLVVLLVVAILDKILFSTGLATGPTGDLIRTLAHLVSNIVIFMGTMEIVRRYARRRRAENASVPVGVSAAVEQEDMKSWQPAGTD